MEVRVLGPIELDGPDGPLEIRGPIPRTVLALLVAALGEAVSTDRLVLQVYGEDAGANRRKRIEDTVSDLRRMLGPERERLQFGPAGYRLDVPADAIDAERFEALAERARRAAADDPAEALRLIDAALALWRGEPYGGTRDSDLLEGERRRLRELWAAAIEEQCELQLRSGDAERVAVQLAQRCGEAAFAGRERVWTLRMRALARLGRQQEAVQLAREAERQLAEHFLTPSRAFRELESRILAHDPTLDAAFDRLDACPYKGLEAYQVDDEHLFWGRGPTLDDLLAVLASTRLVVVSGRSGVGKSSVVRAGLVPAVRRGRLSRPYGDVVVSPGGDAAAARRELDSALAALPAGEPRLVVVDQAEELFTLGWSAADVDAFLEHLAALVTTPAVPARAVVVIRDDLLGRLLEHPRFAPAPRLAAPRAATVVVTPMPRGALREAIRRPAAQVGLTVEDALVERLLDDAAEPGALPLLSHALLQTWRLADRTRGVLTVADYERTGGLHASVARTADEVFEAMDDDARDLVRRVCLELVEFGGPTAPDGRRPAPVDALLRLGPPDGVLAVVEALVSRRLLTVSQSGVELVHEALLRSWPRLAAWMDAERESVAFSRRLRADATAWHAAGGDVDAVYRGVRLERAVAEAASSNGPGDDPDGDVVRAFVDAGVAAAARAGRERRVRLVALGLSAILLAGLSGAVLQRLWTLRVEDAARREARALSPLVRLDGPGAGFGLEAFEVRTEQYRRCVERRRCSPIEGSTTVSPLDAAPADRPVTNVSYHQAVTYCRWIGRRLASQEEFEWAITAGGTRRFPWGDADPLALDPARAPLLFEVRGRQAAGEAARGGGGTVDATGLGLRAVDAPPRSPEGLANLVGNVAEWTATERSATEVVVSGLSVLDSATAATAGAFSVGSVPAGAEDIGFRCAQD